MKKTLTLAATALLFTTLGAASAFAEARNPQETWRDGQYREERPRDYGRDHDRVTVEGRVTRVIRERGGLRIELDRGRDAYWLPYGRLSGRDLREGAYVHIRGTFDGNIVVVDDIDRELRGIVERVNYRLNYLVLRERDGDFVKVDLRPVAHRHIEPDTDDIRRGDAIAMSGDWSRDDLFRAERIDRLRGRW